MKPPSYKLIDPNEIKPGDHFEGYEGHTNSNGTRTSHFVQIEVGEDGVAREWGRNPVDINKVAFFRKPLTWEERDAWYKSAVDMTQGRNQLNLMGLHNDMYQVGEARHEMWNGWIQTSWEEQLIELLDEDFFIIGIVDPAPPRVGLPMRHPVAIVIEYDDGARYWCHAEWDWIDDMRQESKVAYERLMKNA